MTPPDEPPVPDESLWAPPSSTPAAAAELPAADGLLAGYGEFTLIARGGDSVVYRAHQPGLNRDVAVKVVELDDPDTIARFRRELAITVRLGRQHPHIVTVLDTGTTADGHPCLVMDYFELGSLQDRVAERGPLPISDVVTAGSVVADALSFAHAQGVLHRDVKPQNILVLPTSYVLADFGLARAVDAGHSSSLERFSYRHASPQVLDGLPPSTADDLYSLGSTLYTLLDGRPPFAAEDPDEDSALSYLRRARTGEPRALARSDVPPALATIVARCLAREPGDRFATAAELRRALDAVPTETRGWAPDATPTADPGPAQELPTAAPATAAPATAAPATAAPAAVAAEPPSRPALELPPVRAELPPVRPEPEPVAVSALAHVGRPATHDDGATGVRPADPPAPPAEPAAEPRRRTPRWWTALAAAFILAVGIGAVIALAQRPDQHAAGPGPRSSVNSSTGAISRTPSVVTSGPSPTVRTTASARINQKIRPTIKKLVRSGSTFTITFTDATHGQASFGYLLADDPAKPTAISGPPPGPPASNGTLTVTLTGPSAVRHCIAVVAVARGSDGVAEIGTSIRSCSN